MTLNKTHEIYNISKKDGVEEKINLLISSKKNDIENILDTNDFCEILNFIKTNYYLDDKEILNKIKLLLNNDDFLIFLNNYIEEELNIILSNDSSSAFKEISFFIFLLGFGKYNGILQDLNEFDRVKLGLLFNDYSIKILNNNLDNKKKEIIYNCFLNFISVINTLCLLNQMDYSIKKLIQYLLDELEIKFHVFFDEIKKTSFYLGKEEKINNDLNYIEARTKINFSHIGYVSIKNKNIQSILDTFESIINNQIKGFNDAKESNFGNQPKKENKMKTSFLGNMSYSMLILLKKTVDNNENKKLNYTYEDLLKENTFQNILDIFLNQINFEFNSNIKKEYLNLEKLKIICNNVFVKIYFEQNNKEDLNIEELKKISDNTIFKIYFDQNNIENIELLDEYKPKEVIEEFIKNPKVNSDQIETIDNLVMFLPNLNLEELLKIGNCLLNTEKYENFSFEFFKLRILETIVSNINEINAGLINEDIERFLNLLINYIEKNKIASQILHAYSKIYLTIAHYYSFCFNDESQKKALEYFTIFSKINADRLFYENYGKDLNAFYKNIGFYSAKRDMCDCLEKNTCKEECEKFIFNGGQIKVIGEKEVKDFKEKYELQKKIQINVELSKILDNALNQIGKNNDEINEETSEILSKNIFHGIVTSHIVNMNSDRAFIDGLRSDNSILSSIVKLYKGYLLIFKYPKIYKNTFEKIYSEEKTYIQNNLNNIISSYLKKKDSLVDAFTGLPNTAKLRSILIARPMSFLKLKLNTIGVLNSTFGNNFGNIYIKKVADILSQIPELKGNIYKLSGVKFGILFGNEINMQEIINKIKLQKVLISKNDILDSGYEGNIFKLENINDGIELDLNCIIGYVQNCNEKIFDKAGIALYEAGNNSEGIQNFNDINKIDNNPEYQTLIKLQTAINNYSNLYENKNVIVDDYEIVPYYQPIYDNNLAVVKYEALLRMRAETKCEGPKCYLDIAKKIDKLNDINEIIIDEIFKRASIDGNIYSINISGENLGSEDIFNYIEKKLKKYNIYPERIIFEILEGEWIKENDTMAGIEKLKKMGFNIALDDFGSKNSNLIRFTEFIKTQIIDILKIDGYIIKSLDENIFINKQLKQNINIMSFLKSIFKEDIKLKDFWTNYYVNNKHLILENSSYSEKEKISVINFLDKIIKEASILKSINLIFLHGIIDICKIFGIKTVAKCIENEKILEECQKLLIDEFQGYYLGRPAENTK